MNIDNMFPSNYLKASDILGRTVVVEILSVQLEEMPDGKTKPVVRFHDKDKGMVLNRINAETIGATLGKDSDGWTGGKIELRTEKVQGPNGITDGIRLRVLSGAAAQQPIAQATAAQDFDDDIPF